MEAREPEDLFEVVDTMARLLGGSVIVEDIDFRVLACYEAAMTAEKVPMPAAALPRQIT